MCPACIANMTLIAAGVGSTGGLTALAMKRIFLEPTENNKQTNLEENRMKIDDLVPKGRDEDQHDFTMDWVRRHDKYGASQKTGSKR